MTALIDVSCPLVVAEDFARVPEDEQIVEVFLGAAMVMMMVMVVSRFAEDARLSVRRTEGMRSANAANAYIPRCAEVCRSGRRVAIS